MIKLIMLDMGINIITDIPNYALSSSRGYVEMSFPAILQMVKDQGIQLIPFLPFSKMEKAELNLGRVVSISDPFDNQLVEVYIKWCSQLKTQQSGIIIPDMNTSKIMQDVMRKK